MVKDANMRLSSIVAGVAFLLALFVLPMPVYAQGGIQKIIVGLNSAPPYRTVREGGKATIYSGYYVDVFRAAAARAGFRPVFVQMPVKRALASMQMGTIDIMLGLNWTEEREKSMKFVAFDLPAEVKSFLTPLGASDIRTMADLQDKTIGIMAGASYKSLLQEPEGALVFEGKDSAALLKMLETGRLDVVVVPKMLAIYQMKETGVTLQTASLTLPGKTSHFALSRKSQFLTNGGLQKFEAALRELADNGTLDRIGEVYGLSEVH